MGQSAASRPGSSHIWDSPDSDLSGRDRGIVPYMGQSGFPTCPAQRGDCPTYGTVRGSPGDRPIYGTIRIPDLSGVEGGLSHIWDSPRLPGRGDRPIYGTIRIPDLSGAEGRLSHIWDSPRLPGGSSHIWDNPDSRPVRRRGGIVPHMGQSAAPGRGDRPIYGTIRIPDLSGVEGGLSHIWDSPRLPGRGDRPIYGTIRIPDLSGAEGRLSHIWDSPRLPGGSSHIWDNPDSRPVRRRGGLSHIWDSPRLPGGSSHIWDNPDSRPVRRRGKIVPHMGQSAASPGDRPIYGTIRIPDLSGAEGGCFPTITPRPFGRGDCPCFHDIPARYRVGLSGRSRAWRRSGGSLREGRRVIPGMEGPNFVATKKCALFYGATKFGLRGALHIQNAGSLSRSGVFHLRNARPWASDSRRLRHYPHPPMCSRGLSHGVSSASSGAFPRGLPKPMPGFPRGSFPRRRTRRVHGTCSDETSALPGIRPRRSNRPVRPGLLKAFSRDLSREAHGKGMGGWG
jgi:hypothetical protein